MSRRARWCWPKPCPTCRSGVHLGVVDPDVGAERRAVALELADGQRMVGPDNGLLMAAAEQCGGVLAAADIARSPFRLEPVAATFHGRDIFAPVAAALANGVSVAEVGAPLDPAELIRLELPVARMDAGVLVAHVRYVDGFGNLQLNAGHDDLAGTGLKLGHSAAIAPRPRAQPVRPVRADLRGRRAGRAAALRGRRTPVVGRRQPRRRIAAARGHDRRRAADPSPVTAAPTVLGRPRLHLRSTDSTNSRAQALALAGAPHGTLVTASEQSAGAGRQGRSWTAPAGRALLCSVLVRDPPRLIPLAAGVAVAEVAGDRATVKWPNDVLIEGRKVAGILVEGRPQERWAVVGIGLNVAVRPEDFPAELRRTSDDPRSRSPRRSSRPSRLCSVRWSAGWPPTPETVLAAVERAGRAEGTAGPLGPGIGHRRRDRRRGPVTGDHPRWRDGAGRG